METYNTGQYDRNIRTPLQLPNATAVLVLGIISLVMCGPIGLICGIISLTMANKAKAEYQADPARYTSSSYSNMNAGRTCALIGVILSSIGLVFLIIYFAFIATILGTAAAFH